MGFSLHNSAVCFGQILCKSIVLLDIFWDFFIILKAEAVPLLN
jgi:hypothetical protein